MKEVNVTKLARGGLSPAIKEVEEGGSLAVTLHGKVAALLVTPPPEFQAKEYEIIVDPTGDEWRTAGTGCVWLVRPKGGAE